MTEQKRTEGNESSGRAPEWDQGMGLSWSGRWHVLRYPDGHGGITKCGFYVYLYENVPRFNKQLQRIARGGNKAPVCKKCVPVKEKRERDG